MPPPQQPWIDNLQKLKKHYPQLRDIPDMDWKAWRSALHAIYQQCTGNKERHRLFRRVYIVAKACKDPRVLWFDEPQWIYTWIRSSMDNVLRERHLSQPQESYAIWIRMEQALSTLPHASELVHSTLKAQYKVKDSNFTMLNASLMDQTYEHESFEQLVKTQIQRVHALLRSSTIQTWIENHKDDPKKRRTLVCWMSSMCYTPDVHYVLLKHQDLWDDFISLTSTRLHHVTHKHMHQAMLTSTLVWENLRCNPHDRQRMLEWLLRWKSMSETNAMDSTNMMQDTSPEEKLEHQHAIKSFFHDPSIDSQYKSWLRYLLDGEMDTYNKTYIDQISMHIPKNPAEIMAQVCDYATHYAWAKEQYAQHGYMYERWGCHVPEMDPYALEIRT